MARRVNIKFLGTMGAVVAGLAVGGFAMSWILNRRHSAREFEEIAERYEKQGNTLTAISYYGQAVNAEPNNITYLMKYGDMLYDSVSKTSSPTELAARMELAVKQWELSLEVDPSNFVVLKKLMDAYVEDVEVQPVPREFGKLKRIAEKMSSFDPQKISDASLRNYPLRAKAWAQIAVLGSWLGGGTLSDDQVDRSIAALRELMPQMPDMVEIPFYIARAYARRGTDRQHAELTTAAAEYFDKAASALKEGIKAQPDNPLMKFRAYQVLIAFAYRGNGEIDPKYATLIKELIDSASATMPKTQEFNYIDVKMAAARFATTQDRGEEAEKILRDLAKDFPDRLAVRIELARGLRYNAATRDEAIKLLAAPVNDHSYVGYRAMVRAPLEVQRMVELIEARIDAYASTPDEDARRSLMDGIDEIYVQLAHILTEDNPNLLKLKARKLLLQQQQFASVIEAVRLLQKSYDEFKKRGIQDNEEELLLARSYYAAREYGQAKSLGTEMIEKYPQFREARELVAEALLRLHDVDAARAQLDVLDQQGVKNQKIIQMRLDTLRGTDDRKKIADLLAQVPETTPEQKYNKVMIALRSGDLDTAEKLLIPLREKDEYVVPVARLLAQIYLQENKTPDAIAVLKHGLEIKKDDNRLKLSLAAVEKKSVAEVQTLMNSMFDDVSDPEERELRYYEAAIRSNHPDEAWQHLKKAEAVKPDNGDVQELIFRQLLKDGKYDEAGEYSQKLAKSDWDHMNGLTYRYETAMAKRNLVDAQKIALEMTQKLPEFARTWLALGEAQRAARKWDAAADNYTKALEKQGTSLEALRGLVECSYRLNALDKAKEYIALGMRQFPDDRAFLEASLQHEERYGDPDRAIADRKKQMQAEPEVLNNWLSLAQAYLSAGLKAARQRNGNTRALAYMDEARKTLMEAKGKNDWIDDEAIYLKLVDVGYYTGKSDEALAALREFAARPKWVNRPEPHLLLGDLQKKLGHVAEAEKEFLEALAKSDNDARIQVHLVKFYEETAPLVNGQIEKAIALLLKLSDSGANAEMMREVADLQLKTGKLDEAAKTLTTELAKHPNDVNLVTMQGILFSERNDLSHAEEQLVAAVKLDPKSAKAQYALGKLYLRTRRADEAIKRLKIAEDLTNSIDSHLALGDAYSTKGDSASAITEYQLALAQDPKDRDARTRLVELYRDSQATQKAVQLLEEAENNDELRGDSRWWRLHANMLAKTDAAAAAEKMHQIVLLDPRDMQSMYLYLNLLFRSSNYSEAEKAMSRLSSDPKVADSWQMHMFQGMLNAKNGNKDDAISEFKKAVMLSPPDMTGEQIVSELVRSVGMAQAVSRIAEEAKLDPQWKIPLASLYMRDNQMKEATLTIDSITAGQDFAKLAPERRLIALRLAGEIYSSNGEKDPANFEKAAQSYVRYVEAADQAGDSADRGAESEVLNNLAWILAESVIPPQPQKAEIYSRRAYETMRKNNVVNPGIIDTHGWILVLEGKLDEAINVLTSAVDVAPNFPLASYHLAQAYMRKNRPALARPLLQRVEQLLEDRKNNHLAVDEKLADSVSRDLVKVANQISGKVNP